MLPIGQFFYFHLENETTTHKSTTTDSEWFVT
jgi:hypothetical protein